MARLALQSVSKLFGSHRAVDDVSFVVADGEFVSLLGPSGCGKTTLLRLIAGFESPTSGRIEIGDQIVADGNRIVPPERRGIGMVFQSYALWPHMTVAENVAFSLRVRKTPAAERTRRVAEALDLVGLAALAPRRPHELSGGQRQRVALARCLAMRPDVVLLDEPLANLDAHLRDTMQQEFKRLHRETGTTLVYVTHDQAEAMDLADRVVVMNDGRIEQLAPPRSLYRQPRTAMVARFIGSGMVVPVDVVETAGEGVVVAYRGSRFTLRGHGTSGESRAACLRASDLALSSAAGEGIPCEVRGHNYRGPVTTVVVSPEHEVDQELRVDSIGEPPAIGSRVHVVVRDGWLLEEALSP